MAVSQIITAIALAVLMTLARIELSACYVVKASVSCVDCGRHYDLSGIQVLIECDQVKKLSTATTEHDGSFTAELPSSLRALRPATDCQARLLGGSEQLYASSKNMASQIIKAGKQTTTYTTATPLTVGKSCSSVGKHAKCGARLPDFASSKTIDLPIPAEFGLPPTSDYIPPFPIIGIP
ncbi:hypothetical protein Nepgr_014508 [Nepenthes gracilis]|uniref:Pollen Ole e 1 allergen and extensin family protein n=1 Tax=Nepenthes gracilis TaxID=150966 RepID=A0AAD3SK64_NEPGR|nr:hypothetical protein Nepgr_014508 [Nepenthes gracilis]